jgi:hypothetical protein
VGIKNKKSEVGGEWAAQIGWFGASQILALKGAVKLSQCVEARKRPGGWLPVSRQEAKKLQDLGVRVERVDVSPSKGST